MTKQVCIFLFITFLISGCAGGESRKSISASTSAATTSSVIPTTPRVTPTVFNISDYAFPEAIDPAQKYLFYIHGKIIEDQGIPAISPEFGEYEYAAILEKLSAQGFIVISEQRPKNTDGIAYARRVADQVQALFKAGIPEENITVVGASKGAAITMYVSHFLEKREMNYVILGACHPDTVHDLMESEIYLFGNVLSIYDTADDEFAGSCEEYFAFSKNNGGLARHDEIVLNIGTGHGILYKPLDEWILPSVRWARSQ
jgi:hypothetical protein